MRIDYMERKWYQLKVSFSVIQPQDGIQEMCLYTVLKKHQSLTNINTESVEVAIILDLGLQMKRKILHIFTMGVGGSHISK